ncbi:MAG: PHP domain-containing protein [Peptococcaceae bacterium]|nr:PHP domain-containing protein [Peptococcaceae bacterium]
MSISKFEADLHCHTIASDGELSPEEVVELALEIRLKALAITDHDTIGSLARATQKAKKAGLYLLPGIEINTDGEGKEVHILGYGLDENNYYLKQKLQELREKRIDRVKKILHKLRKLGLEISFQQVVSVARGDSVGRPHIAQAMVEYGLASSFKEAFTKYLKIGAPAYVPREKITPVLAINIIRQAGGVAVLAHPGSNISQQEIEQWKREGLQGIEVSHPDHSPQQTEKYKIMAKELNLIATGGSDYHGPSIKPEVELGQWGTGLETLELIEKAKTE